MRRGARRAPDESLTSGGLLWPVLRLSFPTMVANVLQSGFLLVDLWFLGRLGTEALAAVSVSGVVMSVILPFVIGMTVGSNAVISRAAGAGDSRSLNRAIFTILVFAVVLSVTLGVAGFLAADSIIGLFDLEPEVHVLARGYIRILFVGSASMVCLFLINAVLRALGDATSPLVVLVVSTLLNLGLDPLLIYGPGPFPRLEVDGAAIASVAARTTGLVVAATILARRYMPRPLISVDYLSPRVLLRIISIGVPSSISMIARQVSGLLLTFIVVRFGTEAVAAYGVCQRMLFMLLMPGFGFAIGAAVLTGQNLGAGKPSRAEKSTWIAVATYGIITIAVATLYFLVPGRIVSLFDDAPRVVEIGEAFFRINAPALLFLPLGLVLSRSMSGSGWTVWPMVLTVTVLVAVRIPLAWFLSIPFGIEGVFWALALPTVIEGLGMLILFRLGFWKTHEIG